MAEQYGVPVILHTDHCAKKLLPWIDGLLAASERYHAKHGEPLFSSHMLDLSEEPLDENIEICVDYMKRMAKMDMLLEMELGITGGEEDGVDNTDVKQEDLYTKVRSQPPPQRERVARARGGAATHSARLRSGHAYAPRVC